MNTFLRFFYEFISIFFEGLFSIFKGIFNGLGQMFDFQNYMKIINSYKDSFQGSDWVFVAIAIAILVVLLILIGLVIYFTVSRIIKFKKMGSTKDIYPRLYSKIKKQPL